MNSGSQHLKTLLLFNFVHVLRQAIIIINNKNILHFKTKFPSVGDDYVGTPFKY